MAPDADAGKSLGQRTDPFAPLTSQLLPVGDGHEIYVESVGRADGIPAVYLGLTQDHAISASAFAAAGMGLNLGVADEVFDADIARAVQDLLNRPAARREMRRQAMALIDGQGAARIAADLSTALTAARTPLRTAL